MASYCNPSLSTVRIPRDAMGYEAFRLLERMYGVPLKRGTEIRIATSFIARGSTGRCRSNRNALHDLAASAGGLKLVGTTTASGATQKAAVKAKRSRA